ncbi:MAG: hypothetical protein RM368_31010 [Nostoc sp. DedSLP03]|uniref:hypothetical protein n=1 Tax=Nostoc sp. DedSLP03 TaxID=3075400 RepID=UPI002AD59DBB|nr:hypothetical protein [Nostoc sp. DedSLP03]MDZ7969327.1 hypothetical protein [Nostoc sp. DedSLP03]
MILLVLWDGHLARPLYFRAGRMPTPQESSLDSATPKPNLDMCDRHISIRYNIDDKLC